MKAKEFYSKRAIKHQLRRAIKRDGKYFEDAIIQIMEDYKNEALKNMESSSRIISESEANDVCDTCKSELINYTEINRRTCRCGRMGYNVTDGR